MNADRLSKNRSLNLHGLLSTGAYTLIVESIPLIKKNTFMCKMHIHVARLMAKIRRFVAPESFDSLR
jgi:hypothetical protein